jgi:hypothetical protein
MARVQARVADKNVVALVCQSRARARARANPLQPSNNTRRISDQEVSARGLSARRGYLPTRPTEMLESGFRFVDVFKRSE